MVIVVIRIYLFEISFLLLKKIIYRKRKSIFFKQLARTDGLLFLKYHVFVC